MTGGKASRNKGNRFEREIVDLFQEHGLAAERVPLSGAAGGKFSGDVSVPVLGIDRCIEAKIRKSGFGQIYAWLEGNYAVVSRRDRSDPLITLRLADFARLAAVASREDIERRYFANDNHGEVPFA